MLHYFLKSKISITCAAVLIVQLLTSCSIASSQVKKIENLPDSFYNRPGLEDMPRFDYASMPVVNVQELGALGDGEQIANPYFERGVAMLKEQGGGVLFIPKGKYHFELDEENPASMITAYGKTKPGNIWHPGGDEGLENIHFVGEGMESVLEFEFTETLSHYAFHANCLMIDKGVNVSLRDLSLTSTPFNRQRRAGDVKTGNAFRTTKSQNIQLINVHVDQGDLGLGFFYSKDIWVVDCDIRNTRADNVKVDDCDEATVAYNYMEEPMDDNTSMIYYTKHRDTPSHGYRFLHNTLIGPGFGRGYIMCGDDILVEGNWIERTYGNGITAYGALSNYRVLDNTMVRTGLAARPGNPRWDQSKSNYSSAMSVSGRNGEITGNRIFGAEAVGIRSSGNLDTVFSQNRVESAGGTGLNLLAGKNPEEENFINLTLEDNAFVKNAEPILLEGRFVNAKVMGNRTTEKVVQSNGGDDVSAGFTVGPIDSEYTDVYAFARAKTEYRDFDAPKEADILGVIGEAVVNVRDYGAKGNGKHNDTEAFQKALAALPAAGGTIYVPEGTYHIAPMEDYASFPYTKIKQHIRIAQRKNIQIKGDGAGSKLVFVSLDHQGIRFIGCENVAVQSVMLTTDQTAPLRRSRSLLDFSGCRGVLAKNITTQGGCGPAVLLDTVNEGLVHDSVIQNSGQYGIRIEGSCQVELAGNQIEGTRDSAIHIDSYGSILRDSDYVSVKKNRINGTIEGAGIVVISGKAQLLDNEIKDAYLSGVYVYQPGMGWAMNELTVRGNLIENCGQHIAHSGILFGTPLRRGDRGRVLIENNTFKDLPHNGVHVAFGRSMIWGPQGFYSFEVRGNTFENVAGKDCWIDLQSHNEGKDDDIRITHLDVENP
ncbi:right-handed parallel beta-helix repeat-containing protein [Coraliomargarita parva]|uniref:right-handed parallel beta-helix repeat-containing protein n=1 Tax=Coraliomargarita parva TaxID=3014050 RepID=UPI0022B3D50D|nr:right-handed parallel beta-helix repeat-containing protein [Coraliomargarita parva]